MFDRITTFDVETPDRLHTRICSIGITRIEDGTIAGTETYLIDPECDFSKENISKHGIRPEDVDGKPTFREFWEQHGNLFYEGVVAGHGISFDLGVLTKTLTAYGIEAKPFRYLDTVKIAKDLLPGLPDYKLPTLCEWMNISLVHHDAGSDSLAAAKILLYFMGISPETACAGYLNTFDASEAAGRMRGDYRQREAINLSVETRALRALKAAFEEVSKDGTIKYEDFFSLLDCIEMYYHYGLEGRYPFDEILGKIDDILEDGVVTQEELEDFTKFCKVAFDPVDNAEDKFDGIVEGKRIILTGDFAIAPRKEVEKMLKENGAIVQGSVTGETDIVIVGKLGSKAWAMGTYGNKVEKAKKLQSRGARIQILKEEDVFEPCVAQEDEDLATQKELEDFTKVCKMFDGN